MPLRQCGLSIKNDFLPNSTEWNGREKRVTVQWRNLTSSTSNKVIKVNIDSDKYC